MKVDPRQTTHAEARIAIAIARSYRAVAVQLSAELHLAGNVAVTSLVNQNQFYPIASDGWASDLPPLGMTTDFAAGSITVLQAGRYWTIATISYTTPDGPDTLQVQVFKNGVPLDSHVATTWTDSTEFPNSVTVSGIDQANAGDTYDVRIQCLTDPGTVLTVSGANLSIGQV
jgi:hypothetical protein